MRGNLVIDAAERGLDEALASLGPARELARNYGAATDQRHRPRCGWAAVWFLSLLMAWWLVALSYTRGMLDVLVSTGGTTADAVLLGVPVTVFENAEGIGIGWRADSPSTSGR